MTIMTGGATNSTYIGHGICFLHEAANNKAWSTSRSLLIVTTHEDANKQGHGNLKGCKTATRCAPSLLFSVARLLLLGLNHRHSRILDKPWCFAQTVFQCWGNRKSTPATSSDSPEHLSRSGELTLARAAPISWRNLKSNREGASAMLECVGTRQK